LFAAIDQKLIAAEVEAIDLVCDLEPPMMQSTSELIVESLVPSVVLYHGVSLYLYLVDDPPRVSAYPEPIKTYIEEKNISL
jgi:hypothetical protein